ncbi:MAG: ABC transporter ATP-binding protein [Rhodobacteraceae bacterium]|nr:ABC transporter ATP-binding protein [Paracoccaceae bacterium]
MLEIRDVTMQFGGVRALDGVSLSIDGTGVYGLIGPNGAGKTTLLNILSGAYRATSGAIRFLGRDITRARAHRIAQAGIGRTYQNIRLFASNTVLENVTVAQNSLAAMGGLQSVFLPASARERALKEEARRLLDLMGLWGKRDYLSGALSYGEQRRLEIARACALRPRLLLLDEPAAGMNSTETDALWGRVEDLRRDGLCVLLVEHDMNLVMRRCDYVFVLNFGELIAAGSPAEIQGDKAVIEAYLGEEDD